MSHSTEFCQTTGLEIAVIGMSARFPGAKCIEEYWANLRDGIESISFFSDEELRASRVSPALLSDPNYVKAQGVLEDVELFDASFFGISPREAEITDPQQRLFLECAWESLEDAGYDPETYEGRIGVYAGLSLSTYFLSNLYTNRESHESLSGLEVMIANEKDHLPTRVSYKLNLKGPSVTVQTACSTSLVAIHMACQGLLSGECNMALAGGVSIHVPQKSGYYYLEGGPHSSDGHCRAFDAGARGTVGSNGVGIVVLKRLEDALAEGDCIDAVIKGSAINNDGSLKVGYTAPSEVGQAEVIKTAQMLAEVEAESISYVEAHGTGTVLGDPIEIAALTQAFRAGTDRKGFCAIGSVKTNIGHTDSAAGVAGLIKTALALKHKMIPPSLHFRQPNPKIDFANSPFYVNSQLSVWEANGHSRRAGVSSFGIGGTNAHVILEEAPPAAETSDSRPWQLLLLSARTPSALRAASSNLAAHLKRNPHLKLADVAYTLQVGRRRFSYGQAVVSQTLEEAVTQLEAASDEQGPDAIEQMDEPPVVFMFPGGGNQHVNMGAEIYRAEPTFREQVDLCTEILKPKLGCDLRELLYPGGERADEAAVRLNQSSMALPAVFVTEYALAKLWLSWGVRPDAMIGHSLGEYVVACLAGVFSLEDALSLVVLRAKLLKELPSGAMIGVPLSESEVLPLMGDGLSLAAINGPAQCVVSGPTEAIDALVQRLDEREVEWRRLHIDVAGHSEAVTPIMKALSEFAGTLKTNPPNIPYVSNVTGTWITPEEATDPTYWARHLRQTVRFADGISVFLKNPNQILLEVGPGQTLSSLLKLRADVAPGLGVLPSMRHPYDRQSALSFLLATLGELWSRGCRVDWRGFYAGESRRRLHLPSYPFERQRYWVEQSGSPSHDGLSPAGNGHGAGARPGGESATGQSASQEKRAEAAAAGRARHSRPPLRTPFVAPNSEAEQRVASIWQELFGMDRVGVNDNFFELGGSSLLALQLNTKLCRSFQVKLKVHTLLQTPTVAGLARLIEALGPRPEPHDEEAGPEKAPALLQIQPGDSGAPLFLVSPIGGTLFGYHSLAQHLGPGQSVYGLQARGLDSDAEPFGSIEEEATHFLEALYTVQPEGPYFLGGASFGGAVAFEMARQLQARRQRVALLALLDTPGPSQMNRDLKDDAEILSALLTTLLGDGASIPAERFRELSPDEQATYFGEQMRNAGKLPPDIELAQVGRILRVWVANAKSMLSYMPKLYHGRITFFRASERTHGQPQYPEAPWIDVAAGGLEIHKVPGDHHTMLADPHVGSLAEQLKRCLEQSRHLF